MFVRYKRTKRLQLFEEQFPEAIDLIARALRAGHAFTTGLGIAAEEMPAPVGTEFKRVYDQQNFGMSMPEALRAMARRVPVLDARFFVTAVLTQRESGGNLAEVLDNLSSVMRDRFKVKRQIRVVSAHGRISGWVLSLVPPVLAGVLFLLQPALHAHPGRRPARHAAGAWAPWRCSCSASTSSRGWCGSSTEPWTCQLVRPDRHALRLGGRRRRRAAVAADRSAGDAAPAGAGRPRRRRRRARRNRCSATCRAHGASGPGRCVPKSPA